MKELKITKGKWIFSEEETIDSILGKRYYRSSVLTTKGSYIQEVNGTEKYVVVNQFPLHEKYWNEHREELKANANLIAEAGNVANETGLTPRELLEQRNELLEALQYAMKLKDLWTLDGIVAEEHMGEAQALNKMYNKIESAINKANGKGV